MSFLWNIAQWIFSLWVLTVLSRIWLRYKQVESLQSSKKLNQKSNSETIESWAAQRTQKASENAKSQEDREVHQRRMQKEDEAIEKWKAQYKKTTVNGKKKRNSSK